MRDGRDQLGALQVPRYKALLLKQRDIMIALTERLRERDERILALQDDLDAGDASAKCASRVSAGCCTGQSWLPPAAGNPG